MGSVISFRRRPSRGRRSWWPGLGSIAAAFALGILLTAYLQAPNEARIEAEQSVSFRMCGWLPRINCVVDGDTFWFKGEKIRIADIDTPETHPPRCDYEAKLGAQATRHLLELLNAGPFTLRRLGDRDEDRYGRKLRVVIRDGRSLGDVLVSEGLARTWTGRRQPWCE